MAVEIWGADQQHWDRFLKLAPTDLFPTVNSPNIPIKTDEVLPVYDEAGNLVPTKVTGANYAKNPSDIFKSGHAYHMKWKKVIPSDMQILRWREDSRLGFGMRCVTLKAIDFDIKDKEHSQELYDFVSDFFSVDTPIPYRARENSGSRMLIYKLDSTKVRKGFTIQTHYGNIEFKFDSQFAALSGRHHTGAKQIWPIGIPDMQDMPTIDDAGLDYLIEDLQENFGIGPKASVSKMELEIEKERLATDAHEALVDKMVTHLRERGEYIGMRDDGAIGVKCPWQHQHTSTRGADDTDPYKTVLYPPGVGGRDDWGFKCMHQAGHGDKTTKEYLNQIGYTDETSGFEPLVFEDETYYEMPDFVNRTKLGVPAQPVNIKSALEWAGLGVTLSFDTFLSKTLVQLDKQALRPLKDSDYVTIETRLQQRTDIRGIQLTKLRAYVNAVAEKNERDVAHEWISSLRWDGVDRLENFHTQVLGTEDTDYNRQCVLYMFSALAGRCYCKDGVKADMVPVFIGRQGCGKSTAILNLAPNSDFYVSVNLASKDDDLKRQLVGKLVVELPELNGLSKRTDEGNKAWITQQVDEWVPKYMEATRTYPRRWIPIGTTNPAKFLKDPTGARRWLPMTVAKVRNMIDTDYIKVHCEQLWAQAFTLFKAHGVMYQSAERLAQNEHVKYTSNSIQHILIDEWVNEQNRTEFTTLEIMASALSVRPQEAGAWRAKQEIENTMARKGYVQDEKGNWTIDNV